MYRNYTGTVFVIGILPPFDLTFSLPLPADRQPGVHLCNRAAYRGNSGGCDCVNTLSISPLHATKI